MIYPEPARPMQDRLGDMWEPKTRACSGDRSILDMRWIDFWIRIGNFRYFPGADVADAVPDFWV